MKNTRFLLIAFLALMLSACASLISSAEEAPATREGSRQQTAQQQQDNRRQAEQDNRQPASTISNEEEGERKLENTFANLDAAEENQPSIEKADEPQPEATRKPAPMRNAVCPIPAKPCHHRDKQFDEWELSFRLPAKIADNKTYSSAPFYAVILKTMNSAEDCDGGEFHTALENERKEIQNLQPEQKVFASYMCPNMGAVDYDFKGKMDASGERVVIENFIAVYAGQTEEEAEVLRRSMRDEYPQAIVKRMTARWERIVQ